MQKSRIAIALAAGTLGGMAGRLVAQVEISPRFGIHLDHGVGPEFVRAYHTTYLDDDAWEANAKGDVPIYGVRLGFAFHPLIRIDADLLHSKNAGSQFLLFESLSPPTRSPDSTVSVSHLFFSVRIGIQLTSANSPFHARISAGPVWATRKSSAEALIAGTTTIGGSVGLNVVQRISGRIGIGADALLEVYGSKYRTRRYPAGQGRSFSHRDVLFLGGITVALGKKSGYGWDSGPQLAPRHRDRPAAP